MHLVCGLAPPTPIEFGEVRPPPGGYPPKSGRWDPMFPMNRVLLERGAFLGVQVRQHPPDAAWAHGSGDRPVSQGRTRPPPAQPSWRQPGCVRSARRWSHDHESSGHVHNGVGLPGSWGQWSSLHEVTGSDRRRLTKLRSSTPTGTVFRGSSRQQTFYVQSTSRTGNCHASW